MSQYIVYCEDSTRSVQFDNLSDAKEWAHETNMWFEVVDLSNCDIVYTAEDYEFSPYFYCTT